MVILLDAMNIEMKHLLLIFAVGCGGAPFTLADVAQPAVDAAVPDKENTDGGRGGPGSDAADASDAALEASRDAAPTCTPVAPYTWYCLAGGADPITAATSMCVTASGTPAPWATPSECRCKETYTCACVVHAMHGLCDPKQPNDKIVQCVDAVDQRDGGPGGPTVECTF